MTIRMKSAVFWCAMRKYAVANIREAIKGYIAALEEDGLPIPDERFEAILIAV